MSDNTERSPHILSTSSNLLGLCFVVLTSLKVLNLSENTVIDGFTEVATIFFMISSILSFLSIRTKKPIGETYENIADVVFLGGLSFLFITMMLVTFDFIK